MVPVPILFYIRLVPLPAYHTFRGWSEAMAGGGRRRRGVRLLVSVVGVLVVLASLSNVLVSPSMESNVFHPIEGFQQSRRSKPVPSTTLKFRTTEDPRQTPIHTQSVPSGAPIQQPTRNPSSARWSAQESSIPPLSKLICPREQDSSFAQEMVYWRDIPSDALFRSPFHDGQRRYFTFEYDAGAWNNRRMTLETVLSLAVAMGRTIVLPPKHHVDNFDTEVHYSDIFALDLIHQENIAEMISMEDFLKTEALEGRLRDKMTNEISFPPGNRTNWDGEAAHDLFEWLRNVTHTPIWTPAKCISTFPVSGGSNAVFLEAIEAIRKRVVKAEPASCNGTVVERLSEFLRGRNEICAYDHELQGAPVVHIMNRQAPLVRMLIHFYAFVVFEDWRADLWMKRFIRDHVRYTDHIQCAAARVVRAIREIAKERTGSSEFDAFHIRRNDFKFVYPTSLVNSTELYESTKDHIPENATIYIATDEKSKDYFQPMRDKYTLVFLDDVKHVLEGVDPHLFGMIDQLVTARARNFFGTYQSTFTAYITRIRGYHALATNAPGASEGLLPTTYYFAPRSRMLEMQEFHEISGGFFQREYPIAWRNIDKGIGLLPH